MNKDVIYVEPEDDITDIILKIEKSKEKIVALVPPKKAGVFRSVVNIKLIAKAGVTSGKTVVLVTVDPSITKLAAATKIPVAKNLQTAPTVPVADTEPAEEVEQDALIEESDGTVETEKDVEDLKKSKADRASDKKEKALKINADEDMEEPAKSTEEEEEEGLPAKKSAKQKKAKPANTGGFKGFISSHKKTVIAGAIGAVVLIVAGIWAFAIAPAVTMTIGIKTTSNNFSENVTFTTEAKDENVDEGVFTLQKEEIESVQEVKFTATGQKNIGDRASGEVVVYAYFKEEGAIPIGAGATFTFNGMSYTSDSSTTLSWNGEDANACENNGETSAITSGCLRSARVKVTAADSGEKYNVAASNSGWNTTAPVAVYSDKAMTGGTDKMITVVQQSDIEKAKNELTSSNEQEDRDTLLKKIDDDKMIIESTFDISTSQAVASPGVGEEVKDGVTPSLKATTTASMYVLDKAKLEQFITSKANLNEHQKIYQMNEPFIENFSETRSGYAGRLKSSYLTGPKITENEVIEKVRGKGLGEAQHDLKDIDGIASVTIDKTVPWVMSVPTDVNKITIIFEVKDQNGNSVEDKNKDQE